VIEANKLIHDSIKDDRNPQNQLYSLFASHMFFVCLRYSKNKDEAEDILQEGFMNVFTFLQQYNFEGSFEGWIRKIMVNCAWKKYRSKKRLHAVVDI